MSRGIKTKHNVRKINGDWVYDNTSIAKLINKIMYDGQKQIAAKIVYSAIDKAITKISAPDMSTVDIIMVSLNNAAPSKITTNRVIRGKSMSVPKDINQTQKHHYGISIICKAGRALSKEKGICMDEGLAIVMVDAFSNTGKAIEMKKAIESAAEVNKSYKV